MTVLFQTLRDLWKLLDRRRKWVACLLVVFLIFNGALEMGSVFFLFGYIAALADVSEPANPIVQFYRTFAGGFQGMMFAAVAGCALILIFVVKNVSGLLASFYLMRFAMKRYEHVAARLFEGFLHTRLEIFSKRGNLEPQRILDSVLTVFRISFNPALESLSDLVIILTMLAVLTFMIDPWLVLFAGSILGTGAGIFLAVTRRMAGNLGVRRIAADKVLRQTKLDGFRGLIDARLSNRHGTMVARFTRGAADFALADRRSRVLDLTPRALNEVLLASGIVVAAVYFATIPGGIQGALPTLAVLGFAGLRITAALSRLSSALQSMRGGERERNILMNEIEHTAPGLLLGGPEQSPQHYLSEDRPLPANRSGRLTERLTLEGVNFTYPDADLPAVGSVSVDINRGNFVGFCGPSGGGKSTLVLLIMGLIRPQSGRVLCDGWDVFQHLRAWHKNLGYVSQSSYISPRSVRENVAFGYEEDEIDDNQVWRALEMASIADMVRSRPDGLDTNLGEEGVFVSGGQRQRLIIARALYSDPDVLVFDEATAALDTQTEMEVTAAISKLSSTKTIICIAHRISTIRDADIIHVVDGGQIVASGTYHELEGNSPIFRKLALGAASTPKNLQSN